MDDLDLYITRLLTPLWSRWTLGEQERQRMKRKDSRSTGKLVYRSRQKG